MKEGLISWRAFRHSAPSDGCRRAPKKSIVRWQGMPRQESVIANRGMPACYFSAGVMMRLR